MLLPFGSSESGNTIAPKINCASAVSIVVLAFEHSCVGGLCVGSLVLWTLPTTIFSSAWLNSNHSENGVVSIIISGNVFFNSNVCIELATRQRPFLMRPQHPQCLHNDLWRHWTCHNPFYFGIEMLKGCAKTRKGQFQEKGYASRATRHPSCRTCCL